MANADLVAQIIKLATDSKKKSSSKAVDGWQDQIMALARQIQPEAAPAPPPAPPPPPPPPPVGPIAGLTVQPTSSTVEVGLVQQFVAQGWVAGQDTPVTPAVTWTSTGGNISQTGLYKAGQVPGTYQVTAKLVDGPQEETVPIVVMAQPIATRPPSPGANPTPTATKLAMSTQPAGARDSTLFDTQPAVRLQDVSSANVSEAGRTVTVAITSGTGSLSGTLSKVTDSSGIATFDDLKIVGSGSHTLRFTSSGLTQVDSSAFTVNAASKVVFSTQPAGANSGVAFTTQPVGQLQDTNSLNVTKSGVAVTASKASGTGTLSGTTDLNTNASGAVVYTDLVLTGSGGHTLGLASTGLTSATSSSFTVGSGSPPWLEVDFAGMSGVSDIQAASWYRVSDYFNASKITIDTGDGPSGGSGRSMKYTFSPGDGGIGIGMALPSSQGEIWTEIWVKLSAGWDSSGSCGGNNPDQKFVFWQIQPGERRDELKLGNFGTLNRVDVRRNFGDDTIAISAPANLNDDTWHRYRVHGRVGSNPAIFKAQLDSSSVANSNPEVGNVIGGTGSYDVLWLGANRNCNATVGFTMKWGIVRVYTSDPGWGF